MQPSRVNLHLTSFGPFLDVVDNPSQRIGKRLESLLESADADAPLTLVHHETLEVSIEAVSAYFTAQPLEAHKSDLCDRGDCVDLLVHLGVHRGARGEIRVELRAANDLHCPQGDFRGNKVIHQPIVCNDPPPAPELLRLGNVVLAPSESSIEAFETNVPRGALEAAVVAATSGDEEGRFRASMAYSTDAGRYLCNYCYCNSLNYTSLHNAATQCPPADPAGTAAIVPRCMSLFVHVLDPDHGCEASNDASDAGVVTRRNPSIEQQASCIAQFLVVLAAAIAARRP